MAPFESVYDSLREPLQGERLRDLIRESHWLAPFGAYGSSFFAIFRAGLSTLCQDIAATIKVTT